MKIINLRQRNKVVKFNRGSYSVTLVILFCLFITTFVIQQKFANLEIENSVHDPGGTSIQPGKPEGHPRKKNLFRREIFHSRQMFENRLRRLLDIMESNLDYSTSELVEINKTPLQPYFQNRMFDCSDFSNITDMTYLASGWTKAVYRATLNGLPVAVKTVDMKGQDVKTCMASGLTLKTCYLKAAKKIIKEIVLLQALAGENILKVLGFCLPRHADDNLRVAMVTELGEAVDLIKLLQMSWEDRLRICLDITRIVHFMSRTPYGSMSINDFRRQQFVLVDGALKLSDVDDTGFEDPTCKFNHDCDVVFSGANFSQRTRCVLGKCVDVNEKKNLYNAGRHFVTFLLPHGAPRKLQPIIDKVVEGYTNLTMSSEQLLTLMNRITALYQSGWYLNRTQSTGVHSTYKKLDNADLPGLHDYRCPMSISMTTCTLSVFDLQEAEDMCDLDADCRAFVLSRRRTWTGRSLVYLKDSINGVLFGANTTLFIKTS